MKKTSRIALVLLASTFLTTPSWAEWAPENKDGSAYSITEGSADDYNFTTTDGENTSYWKINLNPDNFSTQDSITWSTTDSANSTGSVQVQLPNSDTPTTLYYTYTMPQGYTETNASIKSLTKDNVTSKVFENIGGSVIYSPSAGDYSNIDITSDFIDNFYHTGGAFYFNSAIVIGDINGSFIGNYARGGSGGGAIYNGRNSTIGDITGDFIGNYAQSSSPSAYGGAIYNSGTIGNTTGNFIGNYAQGGGAIDNSGTIGNITGDFIGNYAYSDSIAYGGAIDNSGTIGNITGDFIGNYAQSTSNYVLGGAIDNKGTIGDITGDFIGNYAQSTSGYVRGGAVYQTESQIDNITGNFINNHATSISREAQGGAIYNGITSTIGSITGDFIGNYISSESGRSYGGAIYNTSSLADILNITGDFIGNYARSDSNASFGGAIFTSYDINIINSSFRDNHVYGESFSEEIFLNSLGVSSFEELITNMGFDSVDDFLSSSGFSSIKQFELYVLLNESWVNSNIGLGGAIASTVSAINITAKDGYQSVLSGNYIENSNGKKDYQAIYMLVGELNLIATDRGTIQFDDAIDGDGYNINIIGDGTGVVKFNNEVKNVTNFTLGAKSITHLGLNSKVYAQNMNVNSSLIPTTGDVSSPIITVDVEVDKANNTVNAGSINVGNDIEGEYRVIVNSLNSDVLDNTEDAVVPFLFAPNDDENTDSSFSVARVIGSPYLWEGSVNAEGETEGSTWYLNLTDNENPDYDDGSGDEPEPTPTPEPQPKPEKIYAPEVIAGIGLHEAAIEQTRSVVHNVKGKVAAGKEFCPGCGFYDYNWDGKKLRNIWVLAQGESADIEKPIDMEAKIYAVEAGFDIQNDPHNTLGVFASYRKGEYDLSGKGKLRSSIGSEIDIDSYLAGLYYRYDKNFNWLFATVYGGIQQAEVDTEDGIAKFDTDGVEFGASIEVGRTIPLANDLTLDPSVGLYYTQVNFDDVDDNVGKHYEWDDIKHLEAELGAKLEKQFDNAKVYVKPSVIRTFTNGDSVVISGMNKASTYKDQTLGRVEIGGRYGFTDALSAYAWANYTFGSSYDAYALGAGLNYAW